MYIGLSALSLRQTTFFVAEADSVTAEVSIDDDSLRGEWMITIISLSASTSTFSIQILADSDITFTTDVYNREGTQLNGYGFFVQQGPFESSKSLYSCNLYRFVHAVEHYP